ncbi:MAG TPA: ABC transporter ATP-binding protein [Anaerovoracaceae bacterium]|nr:ABC transporter ATP-binding protein [Anaerovoracaceae bacterium]
MSIMKLRDLSFGYGNNPILKDIHIDLIEGKFTSLIGPNGSGKSTLIKLICGINEKNKGNIIYKDKCVDQMSTAEKAREITVIHQKEKNEFPFSCIDTVIMGLHPHRNRFEPINDEQLVFVKDIMQKTDTLQFANKLTTQISGGELQRVIIARALVQRPKLLLMDEAMSDMDVNAKIHLNNVIMDLVKNDNLTVLAINHDLNFAYKFSDEIIAINYGEIDSIGAPEKVMDEEFFERVFKVKADIIKGKGFFIIDKL